MARVPDGVLECSVFIYRDAEDAKADTAHGGGGSGFLAMLPFRDGLPWYHLYVVTASHVVRTLDSPAIAINGLGPSGERRVFLSRGEDWIHHVDGHDVAALAVFPPNGLQTRPVEPKMFVTREEFHEEGYGIGDEAFMVGRLVNAQGLRRNTPAVRFGHISMVPADPILQDERKFKQESLLIECHSKSGFSGSPVFIWRGEPKLGNLRLLGLDWGSIQDQRGSSGRSGGIELRVDAPVNTGMACVVPAWRILEVLNDERLVEKRAKEEAEYEREERRARADP